MDLMPMATSDPSAVTAMATMALAMATVGHVVVSLLQTAAIVYGIWAMVRINKDQTAQLTAAADAEAARHRDLVKARRLDRMLRRRVATWS